MELRGHIKYYFYYDSKSRDQLQPDSVLPEVYFRSLLQYFVDLKGFHPSETKLEFDLYTLFSAIVTNNHGYQASFRSVVDLRDLIYLPRHQLLSIGL